MLSLGKLFTTISLLSLTTLTSAFPAHVGFLDNAGHHSQPQSQQTTPKPPPKHRANNNTYLAPAPRWVIYTDEGIPDNQVVPSVEDMEGFNVLIISFYMSNGPSDQVSNWMNLPNDTRTEIVKNYHANNISIMMSVFGGEDTPTTNGTDPFKFAEEAAKVVKDYQFDGIDIDWEDFKALSKGDGSAEAWVTNLTLALRSHLPNDSYFLTHAPVAPWFTTSTSTYPHGAYRAIATNANSSIDWFNIQYYNQDNMYSTCEHLITQSPDGAYPHTSVFEIHNKSSIPLEKLVIGKPSRKSDVFQGQDYMSPVEEAACLQQAKEGFNWTAGAMFWEFHGYTLKEADTAIDASNQNGNNLTPVELIKAVRGSSFPLPKNVKVQN